MSAELGKQILDAVKAYVATHAGKIAGRVDELASSLRAVQDSLAALPKPEKGDKGEAGVDGKTPTDDELRALIVPLIPTPVAGEKGDKGDPGEKGADGSAPTEEELRALITPLVPAPPPGERGEKGDKGDKGDAGENGRAPTPEEVTAAVAPLIPAPVPGEKGERGEKGADGKDGRDALQLEILPAIDEAKSYPRGLYAKHAGGLWRSFETTFGLRGWECIVEGVAEESETVSEDGRTFTRKTVYSSGREFVRSHTLAVVLDKGVYKTEATYAPGDTVTWGGSMWIAQKREANGAAVKPYGKPGTPDSGWRLAVKAGRDAR